MVAAVVLVVGVAIVVGFAIGRLFALVIAPAGVALFYVGLDAGLWGHGVGEGWRYAMLILAMASALGAAVGVAARRAR
jgi:hypothetical protein